jgi:hypothetical protein
MCCIRCGCRCLPFPRMTQLWSWPRCMVGAVGAVQIKITLLEIYNETIKDMLRSPGSEPEKLSVKEGKDGAMYVPGLIERVVLSRDEVRKECRCGFKVPVGSSFCYAVPGCTACSLHGHCTITGAHIQLHAVLGCHRSSKLCGPGTRTVAPSPRT